MEGSEWSKLNSTKIMTIGDNPCPVQTPIKICLRKLHLRVTTYAVHEHLAAWPLLPTTLSTMYNGFAVSASGLLWPVLLQSLLLIPFFWIFLRAYSWQLRSSNYARRSAILAELGL